MEVLVLLNKSLRKISIIHKTKIDILHEHYSDVMMSAMASQVTSITTVYSTVYSGTDKRKKSKLRVAGLCEGNSPVTGEFPTQEPVTRKMFSFDDVIMHAA